MSTAARPGEPGSRSQPGQAGTDRPSDEELRAYEDEIRKIRVEQVVLESIVTLVNLGMRRTGLMPGTEGERDAAQVRLAIEAVRAHVPVIESAAPEQVAPIRDALSQLQLAYVRIGGSSEGAAAPAGAAPSGRPGAPPGAAAPAGAAVSGRPGAPPASGAQPGAGDARPTSMPGAGGANPPAPPKPGEPGPAQRSGRLWVPGS